MQQAAKVETVLTIGLVTIVVPAVAAVVPALAVAVLGSGICYFSSNRFQGCKPTAYNRGNIKCFLPSGNA